MSEQVHIWRKEPPGEDERTYDPADSRWAYIEPDGTPDREMVERVMRSIVDQIDPLRIILFGSAARGEMHAHSDLDLLVIKEGTGPETGRDGRPDPRTATGRKTRGGHCAHLPGGSRREPGRDLPGSRPGTGARADDL